MPDLSPDTWANIVIGLSAVGGSVGGAILGAREGAHASLKATQALASEIEKRQRASVRLLLRLEIDHNLANLRALQSELIEKATRKKKPVGDDNGEAVSELVLDYYARALVRVAMPAWTRQAWESMTSLLAPALSPGEIEQANRFYGELETILGIREQLTAMLNEKPRMVDFGPAGGQRYLEPTAFFEHAPELASEVKRVATDLLDRGNPIAEQGEGAT